MKPIKQKYEMNATPSEVWNALTKPEIIKIWSGAKAIMSAKKGAKFKLWGGDMFGKNIEVVKNKKLVQEWCTRSFKSKTTFILKSGDKKTIVELIHEDVPSNQQKNYSDGWKQYYLGAMKEMFDNK